MENEQFERNEAAGWLEVKVRFSIFIIVGACAGLAALVWCVTDLIHHRKNGHRISIFIILLLFTDFVELFLSPYILIKYVVFGMFSDEDGTCWVVSYLWLSSRACGLLLNQLVGLLSMKHPLNTVCVFSSPCFIIFYTAVLLFVFICFLYVGPILSAPLVLIVSAITWILSCVVPCSADSHSHSSKKPDYHIVAPGAGALSINNSPYICIFYSFNIFCCVCSFFLDEYEIDFRSSPVCAGLQAES